MKPRDLTPFVINLRRDVARRAAFFERFAATGAPLREPILFDGVDGRELGVAPPWVSRGRVGAFGCFLSHLTLWTRAFAAGFAESWTPILVFEDDATFAPDFAERLADALAELPDDFDLLYLGGQHLTRNRPGPTVFSPNLYRAANVNRLHAYVVGPDALAKLIALFWRGDFSWGSRDVGTPSGFPEACVDHEIGRAVERGELTAFALRNPDATGPDWICGQAAGVSSSTGKRVDEKTWELPQDLKEGA